MVIELIIEFVMILSKAMFKKLHTGQEAPH